CERGPAISATVAAEGFDSW
nr:immunoglobulin heavy chain junction region [Macaca mulatta]MOW23286.1 immunoglobulin heavy chain junction region [Macaca mulatta]MOW23306.1 immunoglobulin heavy chain junction region [Macaca mulatta]MOW23365.1 immunoglobulin heavy chain junction region [Macaca mulatta]MOW23368.1 immunoglobulin heavy chain junction region [Macaca mulatta]